MERMKRTWDKNAVRKSWILAAEAAGSLNSGEFDAEEKKEMEDMLHLLDESADNRERRRDCVSVATEIKSLTKVATMVKEHHPSTFRLL